MNHNVDIKREDRVGSVLKFMNKYRNYSIKGKQKLLILKTINIILLTTD